MNNIIHLNNDNFQENIDQKDKLLLIDFWATWCTPCKIISITLEEIKNEFNHKLIITKLNIDEYPNIANKYNICSIPTIILIYNNKVIATKIGILSKNKLKEFINQYILQYI